MPYSITLSRKKLDIPEANLSSPKAVHDFAQKHVLKKENSWRESCHMLTVDKGNNVQGIFLMSLGTEHQTTVDPGLAARVAIMDGAPSVVLVHNHPGSNPHPSSSDIEVTDRLRKTLAAVGISLIDHVIISDDSFFSFSEDRITKAN